MAEFLFQRGAMTIKDLIDNFGSKFGLTVDDVDDYYLNARYLNNVPLEQVWNTVEDNPKLEMNSILSSLENELWGTSDDNSIEDPEADIGQPAK